MAASTALRELKYIESEVAPTDGKKNTFNRAVDELVSISRGYVWEEERTTDTMSELVDPE